MTDLRPTNAIKVGDTRHRKVLGDIDGLAASGIYPPDVKNHAGLRSRTLLLVGCWGQSRAYGSSHQIL